MKDLTEFWTRSSDFTDEDEFYVIVVNDENDDKDILHYGIDFLYIKVEIREVFARSEWAIGHLECWCEVEYHLQGDEPEWVKECVDSDGEYLITQIYTRRDLQKDGRYTYLYPKELK